MSKFSIGDHVRLKISPTCEYLIAGIKDPAVPSYFLNHLDGTGGGWDKEKHLELVTGTSASAPSTWSIPHTPLVYTSIPPKKFSVGDAVVGISGVSGLKSGTVKHVYYDGGLGTHMYELDLYGKGNWYFEEERLQPADEYFGRKKVEDDAYLYHVCRDNIVNAGFTSYKPVCKVCDRDIQAWEIRPTEEEV